ncbi:MAG TPA: phosphopantothenoylcysteine decarboxylase, partial [Candidatus Polarisedimenticolia bacterium]|nr:phosphopantothenoylcysteine decarboxylase [Candidatus Polarisedimenticolia bacterium]
SRAAGGDGSIALRLVPTPDILEEVGRRKKPGQVLVGFAAETGDLSANALKKLHRKNLDLIVANRIGEEGEGFEADTNRALVIDRHGRKTELALMSKGEMARVILDLAAGLFDEAGEGTERGAPRAPGKQP